MRDITSNINIVPAGDRAMVLEFENQISPEVNAKVNAVDHLLSEKVYISGVTELVPTYRSLLIYYDPQVSDFENIEKQLYDQIKNLEYIARPEPETLYVPVVYGGRWGPDLNYVAKYNELSCEEVIEIHHSSTYLIYMLGFVPGFTYLGGMSSKIATPRLENPRAEILKGSVGIAGSQTGVYPLDSPGGWQIIGRTPLNFFDPYSDDPFLPKPGNYLKFYPITENEFMEYKQS